MNQLTDKKGTDKILSVYWFAILFIVAGAIIYMTTLYYGEPYDVRELEASILTNQIADCLSQGGQLIDNWKELNNDTFLEKCHLTFNVEDTKGWKNDQYYVNIDFYNFNINSGISQLSSKSIAVGNINLKQFCNQEEKNLPVCVERNFYTLDNETNQYVIKILSVIGKT
jgi:hypothetical protein